MLYTAFKHIFEHTSHEQLGFTNGSKGASASCTNQVLAPLDGLLTMSPTRSESGSVGNTLGGLFELLTSPPAGLAAFQNESVNTQLEKIFDILCTCLKSDESANFLSKVHSG